MEENKTVAVAAEEKPAAAKNPTGNPQYEPRGSRGSERPDRKSVV